MTRLLSGVTMFLAVLSSFVLLPASAAQASKCIAFVERQPAVVPASFTPIQSGGAVEITYITHSTFRLRTPAGVTIATDYAGYAGPGPAPTVVTMNHAHETHFTAFPDPDIQHVLRGWNPQGGPAVHKLTIADVFIRNVSTDIRSWGGGVEPQGNSIFIFEVAGLCIGHLGHLHHEPSDETYAAIGRLDVVMAAVDGGMTVDIPTMIRIVKRLRSSVVLPMHWFSGNSLDRFLEGVSDDFLIDRRAESDMELSLRTLPSRPTVVVLQPRYLSATD